MKKIYITGFLILFLASMVSCKQKRSKMKMNKLPVSVKTTQIIRRDIENAILLNGKTVYLKKDKIISPISGYVIESNVKYGDKVRANDLLFTLQTRESKVLNGKSGFVKVIAHLNGIVSDLIIHQKGDFLVEGNLLCTLVNNRDLVIQANVPFEYNATVKKGKGCRIFLPDNTEITGTVSQVLPMMNPVNQTQTILIKPNNSLPLPQNLHVTIQFTSIVSKGAFLVPKEALMTNEMQNKFWLIKILHDSVAIKTPVIKGIENDSLVEIMAPGLDTTVLVITQGAYGLPDSIVVKIAK